MKLRQKEMNLSKVALPISNEYGQSDSRVHALNPYAMIFHLSSDPGGV